MDQDDVTIVLLLSHTPGSLTFSAGCAGGSWLSPDRMVPSPLLLVGLLRPGHLWDISSDDNVLIRDDELVVLIELALNVIDALNSTTRRHRNDRLPVPDDD